MPGSSYWVQAELTGAAGPVGSPGTANTSFSRSAEGLMLELMIDWGALGLANTPVVGRGERCGWRNNNGGWSVVFPVTVRTVPRVGVHLHVVPRILASGINAITRVGVYRMRMVRIMSRVVHRMYSARVGTAVRAEAGHASSGRIASVGNRRAGLAAGAA